VASHLPHVTYLYGVVLWEGSVQLALVDDSITVGCPSNVSAGSTVSQHALHVAEVYRSGHLLEGLCGTRQRIPVIDVVARHEVLVLSI
jgi:hypothetical protein